jgi:hypothetical protein
MPDERAGEPVEDFPRFDLTEGEQQIVACYEQLRLALTEHGDDLPPFVERNAIKALAALWQVANGEATRPGQIYDLGA